MLLTEHSTPTHLTIDPAQRLVKDIALAGLTSKNGYRYTESALQSAVPLYDRKPVFLDHPASPTNPLQRSTRDLVGNIANPRYEAGRIRSDIEILDTEAGRTFLALAQSEPPSVGMSHVVLADKSNDNVDRIHDVLSVDAVLFPATTTTLREQSSSAACSIAATPPALGTPANPNQLPILNNPAPDACGFAMPSPLPPSSHPTFSPSLNPASSHPFAPLLTISHSPHPPLAPSLNPPSPQPERVESSPLDPGCPRLVEGLPSPAPQAGSSSTAACGVAAPHSTQAAAPSSLGAESIHPRALQPAPQVACGFAVPSSLCPPITPSLKLSLPPSPHRPIPQSSLPPIALTPLFAQQLHEADEPTRHALIHDRLLLIERLMPRAPTSPQRLPPTPTLTDESIIQSIRHH